MTEKFSILRLICKHMHGSSYHIYLFWMLWPPESCWLLTSSPNLWDLEACKPEVCEGVPSWHKKWKFTTILRVLQCDAKPLREISQQTNTAYELYLDNGVVGWTNQFSSFGTSQRHQRRETQWQSMTCKINWAVNDHSQGGCQVFWLIYGAYAELWEVRDMSVYFRKKDLLVTNSNVCEYTTNPILRLSYRVLGCQKFV